MKDWRKVYVQCLKRSYKRSFGAMKKMIRRMKLKKDESVKRAYPKSTWKPDIVSYPGEKVPIDIKYVPQTCIGWDSHGKRYYQMTALDEYSRKHVCMIVDEKSVRHTANFGSTIFGVGDFQKEVINTFFMVYKKVRQSLIIKATKPIKGGLS